MIHASTGTGKTYAAWFGPLLEWMGTTSSGVVLGEPLLTGSRRRQAAPTLRVLWITPLRALARDIERTLHCPLEELRIGWTIERRTGDTPAAVRDRQRDRLPTTLITTPESLSLILSRSGVRAQFDTVRLVVVDEWHELMGSKRGVQVELALARLRHWRPDLRIWGLSATLGNLEQAAQVLLGRPVRSAGRVCGAAAGRDDAERLPARLIAGGPSKRYVIESLIPTEIERFPWAGHLGSRMAPQVVRVIEDSVTSLVFANTRFQAESWYQTLLAARPDWAGRLALHHGSLDPHVRQWVESAVGRGDLKAVVCTSSLDLGVDFPPVDRVLQIGSPKGIARLLQRAGRSGHQPGVPSRVTCVPTHAFELVEVAAARDALTRRQIEGREPLAAPLDVLAQHLVTIAVGDGFREEDLRQEVRATAAYADLRDEDWRWLVDFVAHGGRALRAYPEYQRLARVDGLYRVASRELARRHRLSIGTITSDASLHVQYVRGPRLGSLEESFAAKLKPGDAFVFAGRNLQLVRIHDMTVWVRKAKGAAGPIPRWMGGRMPLSTELAAAVRTQLQAAGEGRYRGPEMRAVRGVLELQRAWSHLPDADTLLIEQLRTREGHHLFFYPFEGRQVHEGLATLWAYRISRIAPFSFSMTVNDYGIELLSPEPAPLPASLDAGLLSTDRLIEDIHAGLNSVEMARRQFREIARIAGLVFHGYPGRSKSTKQLQASASLIYDVFREYDGDNLLLRQANREVLDRQLERQRLTRALQRLEQSRVLLACPLRPTPLAFPLIVDRLRERLSSESLLDRIRRMQVKLQRSASDSRRRKGVSKR